MNKKDYSLRCWLAFPDGTKGFSGNMKDESEAEKYLKRWIENGPACGGGIEQYIPNFGWCIFE